MERPKATQNMRIGDVASVLPTAVKSRIPERLPSWKIQTIAPNVAVRLRMLRTSAFNGTTIEPNIMNSSTNVMPAIRTSASGMAPSRPSLVSTNCADTPVTCTSNGAGVSRIERANASPSSELPSTSGTTDRNVASGRA